MKYDHVIKYNGQYYEAGEDVPNEEAALGGKVDSNDAELPFSDLDIEMETPEHTYIYEELEPMTAKEIRRLAEDKGIRLTKTIKDDIINEFLSKQ